MAGARQKHPDALVFRRGGRVKSLETIDKDGKRQIPPADLRMPDGLHPEAQQVWQETIAIARDHLFPADVFAVERWIHWVNEWLKATETLAHEGVVVSGHRGITRLNPLVRYQARCEDNIVRAETVMGFNPLARMRLGITFAMEQSALASLKGSIPAGPAPMDKPKPRRRAAK